MRKIIIYYKTYSTVNSLAESQQLLFPYKIYCLFQIFKPIKKNHYIDSQDTNYSYVASHVQNFKNTETDSIFSYDTNSDISKYHYSNSIENDDASGYFTNLT